MPRMPVTGAEPPAGTRTEGLLRQVSEYDGKYPARSPSPQPPGRSAMKAPRIATGGHDRAVIAISELLAAGDAAFTITGQGLAPWPDPHADGRPLDEEYSRLLDPAKWRIIGARAEAWLVAVVDAAVATVEWHATVRWRVEPGPRISRTDRVIPFTEGALPLIVARSRLGDVHDAGVTLGLGDPATCMAWLPHCGCDACDSGSQSELDELDRHIVGVASGSFRRLTHGKREITVVDDQGWSASGQFKRREVEAILADPREWEELAGPSWLTVR